jgi:hypothetical protein
MPSSYGLGRKGAAQTGNQKTIDLPLPSFRWEDGVQTQEHNVCKVRVLDPVAMLTSGLLDEFDSLTQLVGTKIQQVEGRSVPSPEVIRDLAKMTKSLEAGIDMLDRLVETVVVEPTVVWPVHRYPAGHPEAGKPRKNEDGSWMKLGPDERDDETLYTDDVDLEDRMFIMQWAVGGIKDPEQFRKEYAGLLESVADEPGLPLSSLGNPTHN